APKFGFGEPEFKLSYAIRGLYDYRANMGARSMDASASVGAIPPIAALDSLIATFNKFSLGNFKISQKLTQDLTRGLTGGFDFLRDIRYDKVYTTSINPEKWLEYQGQIDDAQVGTISQIGVQSSIVRPDDYTSRHPHHEIAVLSIDPQPSVRGQYVPVPTPFGMSANSIDIINVVENRARDDAIKMIVTRTMPSDMRDTDVILANIVDINMVPFDIHVLTRQMPLHFIWNYAFTFDTIAGSMIYDKMQPSALMCAYFTGCRNDPRTGAVPAHEGDDGAAPNIASARDAMFAMISDPYRALSTHEKQWVMRMLVGAHGIPGFARPKFLGDQFVGKVLYGQLYGQTTQPEVGPPSVQANMRTVHRLNDVFTNTTVLAHINPIIESFSRAVQSGALGLTAEQHTDYVTAFVLTFAIANPYENMNTYAANHDDAAITGIADAIRARIFAANGQNIGDDGRDRLKNLIKAAPNVEAVAKVLVKFVFETFDFVQNINWHAANAPPQHAANAAGNRPPHVFTIRTGAIAQVVRSFIDEWKPQVIPGVASAVWNVAAYLMQLLPPVPIDVMSFATSTDEYGMEMRSAIAQPQHSNAIREMRMDTVLARNLMHIGLVLEVVQARLARDLTYLAGDRVAEATSSIDPSIYKLFGTQAQPDSRTPNYEGRNFI
ncbi:MAG: hypothetical protein WC919_03895, partial [Candidatus Paceibacterota bacterium]